MRFVEWKPRMLRTKETQHENTSEWQGHKEGQDKINISKTKIFMRDFHDPLLNWKSLDCNNMLTVDKSQFLDQQKYFEADKFSTCDINSNRIILSLTISLKLSSTLLCYDQSQNSLLSTRLSFSKHVNWSEANNTRLHLNLAHAQQGKSRRLAEVPSSSRLI